jgi:hypothetical protein
MRAIKRSRTADQEVPVLGVANERDAPQSRNDVFAACAPLLSDRVEPSVHRAKCRWIAREATDFAARGDEVDPDARTGVEREAFHGVKIEMKPGESAGDPLVEPSRAGDDARGVQNADSEGLQSREVSSHLGDELWFDGEGLAARSPALIDVVVRARSA